MLNSWLGLLSPLFEKFGIGLVSPFFDVFLWPWLTGMLEGGGIAELESMFSGPLVFCGVFLFRYSCTEIVFLSLAFVFVAVPGLAVELA